MSVYDEMRNDIEVLYGGGACGYNVYSDMVDYIDEAETDYAKLKNENDRLRKERDHWHVEQVHAYGNWEDAHKRASELEADNDKLREFLSKMHGYYVSGTLTPCDFCDKYCCEGYAQTTCKFDEYDPDGIVVDEVERLMRELGIEAD